MAYSPRSSHAGASGEMTRGAIGPCHQPSSGRCAAGFTDRFDGQLYCWGLHRYGEVGNGTSFHASPVAVELR